MFLNGLETLLDKLFRFFVFGSKGTLVLKTRCDINIWMKQLRNKCSIHSLGNKSDVGVTI